MELRELAQKFHEGRNIFLNGPAGTGKTRCIQDIVSMFDLDHEVDYQLLAPTGTAACNIRGITIQSYFHILPVTAPEKKSRINMQVSRSKYQNDGLDLLFIDEISMVGDELFEVVDRILRKNYDSSKPFGGVQCIVCGDFYQLQPVGQKMCFTHKTWSKMKFYVIDFNDQKRYTCPKTFDTLGRIRTGRINDRDKKWLNDRVKAYRRGEHKLLPIPPIELYPCRKDVKRINDANLEKIEGPEVSFESIDELEVPPSVGNLKTDSFLDELADKTCVLKLTIPVIFYRNYDIALGLTNGRSGEIVSINEGEKEVVVRLVDGSEHIIKPKKYTTNGPGWSLSRTQIPIRAGWAMTISKAQGSTMEHAVVSLNCKHHGQGYTALSRVVSIDNLFIKNINYKTLTADPVVTKYNDSIGW